MEEREILYVALSIILWLMKDISKLYRQNKYLTELLQREHENNLQRYNQLVKNLIEIFLREPTPSLKDLARTTDATFRIKP